MTTATKERTDKASLFIRDIPRDTKDRFKAYCARHGKTMTETIVDFMKAIGKK